jgi:uncharacterized protein
MKANRAPTMEDLKSRRDQIMQIAASHGASNVRVFGSVVRGQARPDSDVDFLVDVHTDRRGFEFFSVLEDLRRDLESLLGWPVDVGEAIQPPARDKVEQEMLLL